MVCRVFTSRLLPCLPNWRSMPPSNRQSPARQRYMLCFTSPTMRLFTSCELSSLWLMHSFSNTLKLSHCTALVSWNSSIIMCSSLHPTFSNMNGVSLSFIRVCSRCCVSLSRKRLASLFSSLTFASMLPKRRSLSRCFSVQSAVAYSVHCFGLSSSAL